MNLRKRRNSVISEINITPFTDVVLVLLIIFMITTPMLMQPQLKVNLPKAQNVDSSDVSNIEILISEKGYVYIDGKQVHASNIEDALQNIIKEYPDKAVIIKGDKDVKYNYIIRTMEQAKKAGAVKLALAVDNPSFVDDENTRRN
jgi:biopolymer transport protein ExbD